MDMSLFFAVLWRSKWVVLGGVVLAAVLAALAYGTPTIANGKPTLKSRSAEVWQSESRILISQSDFPYRQSSEASNLAQPLGNLSPIYAGLANGNIVQAEIHSKFGATATVKAMEDIDAAASTFLPFVNLVATAPTKAQAATLAEGAGRIFIAYVASQQAAAGIPPTRRIELTNVDAASLPTLVEGKKLSVPILVFLAILVGVIAILLIRENLRQNAAGARQGRLRAEGRAGMSLPEQLDETDPRLEPVSANGGDGQIHRPHLAAGNVQE
jgi:hypothetical protein